MKANSKFFRKLGAGWEYFNTVRTYLALIQFVMVGIGFIKYMEYSTAVIILICCTSPVVMTAIVYFHVKFILPNWMRYLNERNPATMQLLKNTGDGNIEY